MLIAGLGGGCMTANKKSEPKLPADVAMNGKAYMGPHGEPVTPATYRGQDGGVSRADGRDISMGGIQQVKDEASHERVRQASRGGYVPTGSDGVPGYSRAAASCPFPRWARTAPLPQSGLCPRWA